MDDAQWKPLLKRMAKGKVVAVIGARLLVDGQTGESLYARVARELLNDDDGDAQELPRFRELHAAVTRRKNDRSVRNINNLYEDVDEAIRKAMPPDPPEALQLLAEIDAFRLVVTLTPDDLFAQALQRKGRRFNEVVHNLRQANDLPDGWDRDPDPETQLLYLFGKSNEKPLFAIHDEDHLEYAHNLMAGEGNVPREFLDALRNRDLLFIGCNDIPDWLSRFLLRATRTGALDNPDEMSNAWLVEPLNEVDPFIGFLEQYSPTTSVFKQIEPTAFVAELHRRWQAQASTSGTAGAAAAPRGSTGPASPEAEDDGASDKPIFFISYSRGGEGHGDMESAKRLRDLLITDLGAREAEVWFDQDDLPAGAPFSDRIREGISATRYFLPIVSKQATDRDSAYVFQEWDMATQLMPRFKPPFVIPLVVDPECDLAVYSQPSFDKWRELDIRHAPRGRPDQKTINDLKGYLRHARLTRGAKR